MNEMQSKFNDFFVKAQNNESLGGNDLHTYQSEFANFMQKVNSTQQLKHASTKQLLQFNSGTLQSQIDSLDEKETSFLEMISKSISNKIKEYTSSSQP